LPESKGLLYSEGLNILLTAKDFVDKEFQPRSLCVALCGSSFGSSWLLRISSCENKNFIAIFVNMLFYNFRLVCSLLTVGYLTRATLKMWLHLSQE
jgi:hypothetical protein